MTRSDAIISINFPTSGTFRLPDFDSDIEVMDFDVEAWTPIYVYPYIGVPNFDIEALYFDFDIGPDIGLQYRSPFDIKVSFFIELPY
jgi:hypothetical protein